MFVYWPAKFANLPSLSAAAGLPGIGGWKRWAMHTHDRNLAACRACVLYAVSFL